MLTMRHDQRKNLNKKKKKKPRKDIQLGDSPIRVKNLFSEHYYRFDINLLLLILPFPVLRTIPSMILLRWFSEAQLCGSFVRN